jgi:tetratricopeptide (TPR) repeat protein
MNQKMKAVALCLDYMNRNQESIDYDVANITIELLMSKCCYVEICYFVGALIE